MTIYLKLKEVTNNSFQSPSHQFYLELIDAQTKQIVTEVKLYPRLTKPSVIQMSSKSSLLIRIVYMQMNQAIDLQNTEQKVFGQQILHLKTLVQIFQRQEKERQTVIAIKQQYLSILVEQGSAQSDWIEHCVNIGTDEIGNQELLTDSELIKNKYFELKFLVKYEKKIQLLGRCHFPQVPNLFNVAKIYSAMHPNEDQRLSKNYQDRQSKLGSKMFGSQDVHDFRETIKQIKRNSKVGRAIGQQISLQPRVHSYKQKIGNENQDKKMVLKMYKGPCPSVNLFSVLDSRVEGQNRFNFIERLYRDKNSAINRATNGNEHELLSEIKQMPIMEQRTQLMRKEQRDQESTMRL